MTTELFDTGTDAAFSGRVTLRKLAYNQGGYVIAKARVDSCRERTNGKALPSEITVKGNMAEPLIGQQYEITGELSYNTKWRAHEVAIRTYRTIVPDDEGGIYSYLVNTAKWVGPRIASQLIELYHADVLEVIKHAPECVIDAAIPNLTADRVYEMQHSLLDNQGKEAALIELHNLLGSVLGPSAASKAVKKWGSDAATFVKQNPYILQELRGIGFPSADAVALKLGVDPRGLNRNLACIQHVLNEQAARGGHTVVAIPTVDSEMRTLLGEVNPAVWAECSSLGITSGDTAEISLASLAAAELFVARKLTRMLDTVPERKGCPPIPSAGLAEDQLAAVKAFESAPVFCLVGPPGTGKTYTVARIVHALEAAGYNLSLCAPTGKAAKQMGVALGGRQDPVTIHSLLQPEVDDDGNFAFTRNERNPLDTDCVIVDETSMVDARLGRSLLSAIPDRARLLFVGDHYQLPSVGPGALLRDMLASGVPHVELKQIKRNAGLIVRTCHAILRGDVIQPAAKLNLDPEVGDNWRHLQCVHAEDILEVIRNIVVKHIPTLGVDPLWGWQVIGATNEQGPVSCLALNIMLRPIVNKQLQEDPPKNPTIGDKVVRLKNAKVKGEDGPPDPDVTYADFEAVPENSIRIVNGDLGTVIAVTQDRIICHFRYPDRVAWIRRAEPELKLAYCMTCHKLQGSEVPVVILPLHRSLATSPVVTREWVYTACSRAKVALLTVGDIGCLPKMIRTVGMGARQTLLPRMLRERELSEALGV